METKNKNQNADATTLKVYEQYKKNPQKYVEFQQSLKEKDCKNKLLNKSISDYKNNVNKFIKDFIESFMYFGIQLRIPKRNGMGFIRFDESKNRIKIRFMKTAENYDNRGLKDSTKNISKCLYFLYNSKSLSEKAFKRCFFQYSKYAIHHRDHNHWNDSAENLKLMTIKAHNALHKNEGY